jgi:RsiW-degrading membrane proteinase PrsW (M82 family)
MISVLPHLLFLFIVNVLLLVFVRRGLTITWGNIARFFLYGMFAAIILKLFIYSIGKEMSVDLYFFQIQIVAKDAIGNFQDSYATLLQRFSIEYSFLFVFGITVLPAILEEICKFLLLRMHVRNTSIPFRSIRDYIYAMIVIALGFSFVENILYLKDYFALGYSGSTLFQLIFLRICMSTTSHVLFSGIIAYYYARYIFSNYDLVESGFLMKYKTIIASLKQFHLFHAWAFSWLYSMRIIIVGLFLGILSHILYNLFLYLHLEFISFGFLSITFFCFFRFVLSRRDIGMNIAGIQEKIQILKELKGLDERKKKIWSENK